MLTREVLVEAYMQAVDDARFAPSSAARSKAERARRDLLKFGYPPPTRDQTRGWIDPECPTCLVSRAIDKAWRTVRRVYQTQQNPVAMQAYVTLTPVVNVFMSNRLPCTCTQPALPSSTDRILIKLCKQIKKPKHLPDYLAAVTTLVKELQS